MAKQLMIYDDIQPLSSEAHRNWSVAIENQLFASQLISTPLVSAEIVYAAQEFPIVFSKIGESDYLPLAIMGFREGENLLIDSNGQMTTRYVPGFIRRYPFMLGSGDSENLLVGIDVESSFVDKTGARGRRLFTDQGEHTPYLIELIEFVKDYHFRGEVMAVFCRRLHELDLFEAMTANITAGDANVNLHGFYVINKQKLKALSDDDVLDLFKKDGIEIIYAHLISLTNMNMLTQKLAEKTKPQ